MVPFKTCQTIFWYNVGFLTKWFREMHFANSRNRRGRFACFAKQAVSAKRVSRNTETVILFREKLNKKRCEVNQSYPILLLFRKIFSFSLFREMHFAVLRNRRGRFACFAKQAVSAKRVSRNTEKVILFREKLNKKRCEVNQSFPILLLFRKIFIFLLFREMFRETFRETDAKQAKNFAK